MESVLLPSALQDPEDSLGRVRYGHKGKKGTKERV